MDADALAPSVAKASAAMMLTMLDTQSSVKEAVIYLRKLSVRHDRKRRHKYMLSLTNSARKWLSRLRT